MVQDAIAALIVHGEDEGRVCMSELERLSQELELDDEQLTALYQEIEERGLEMTDDCCKQDAPDATYVNGELVSATTDALQLFLGVERASMNVLSPKISTGGPPLNGAN